MPQFVVDRLEAVEVEAEHRERTRAFDPLRQGQPLVQQRAVGEAGEGVVVGEVLQLVLHVVEVGGVPVVDTQPPLPTGLTLTAMTRPRLSRMVRLYASWR